jgi:hypothetical protein
MNKIVTVSMCLLGLAVAGIPAYASPTNKKITITCTVPTTTDTISGDTTVRLCPSAYTVDTCPDPDLGEIAGTVLCPEIKCDSSGLAFTSVTIPCDAPFRVSVVKAAMDYVDSDGGFDGTTFSTSGLTGKGVTFPYGNPADGDSVSATVK